MILFWVLWVSLVLGGVAGYLCAKAKGKNGLWLRPARVRRPVARGDAVPPDAVRREDFLPVPRVTTHPGSPPGPHA
jgi:hypothetical protein